jgi:uncharacterized protein (TIGR02300 family)
MPAKDLGNKFVCFKCSTKFYDLKKPDPRCPKCGADQRESPALKAPSESRRSRLAAVPKIVEPIAPLDEPTEEVAAEEEEIESLDDDEEVEIPGDEDV